METKIIITVGALTKPPSESSYPNPQLEDKGTDKVISGFKFFPSIREKLEEFSYHSLIN